MSLLVSFQQSELQVFSFLPSPHRSWDIAFLTHVRALSLQELLASKLACPLHLPHTQHEETPVEMWLLERLKEWVGSLMLLLCLVPATKTKGVASLKSSKYTKKARHKEGRREGENERFQLFVET